MPGESLSEAFVALSRFFVADSTLGETLTRVAQIAERAIHSADFVGLTLIENNGEPATAIYTDPASPQIDAEQYAEGGGPCLDALRDCRVVRVADTRLTEARWPRFSRAAQRHGVLSTLSLPLVVRDEGLGAMNLYARTVNAFSPADEATCRDLATSAAVVISNATAYWRTYELTQQLQDALRSRAVIEQAKGVLMAREHLDAEEAFDLLRRLSQQENRKLREVARRLVTGDGPVDRRGTGRREASRGQGGPSTPG